MKANKRTLIKFYILLFIAIFLIIISYFITEASENQGYVQITANVDEKIKEYKANIAVGICEINEDGYSETIYLHELNNYTTNITLPEGLYEINYAMVDGDTTNTFWFSANDTDFVIKKGSPARMYFSLGDAKTTQKNIDNQTKTEEVTEKTNQMIENTTENQNQTTENLNQNLGTTTDNQTTEEITEKLSQEDLKALEKLGLADLYNEDGSLNEGKVKEKYKELMGEEIEETLQKNNGEEDSEREVKEELKKEKKGFFYYVKWFFKYGTLVIAIILIILYGVYKLRNK